MRRVGFAFLESPTVVVDFFLQNPNLLFEPLVLVDNFGVAIDAQLSETFFLKLWYFFKLLYLFFKFVVFFCVWGNPVLEIFHFIFTVVL